MNEGTHVKWLFSGNLQSVGADWFCADKDTAIFQRSRKNEREVIDKFQTRAL